MGAGAGDGTVVDGRIKNPASGLGDVDSVVEIDSRSQRISVEIVETQ